MSTSLTTKFQNAAVKIVRTFSPGDLIVNKIEEESYDAVTGIVSRNTKEYPVEAAHVSLNEKEQLDRAYTTSNSKVYVAGLNISVDPSKGDEVLFPEEDYEAHKIQIVKSDQYRALFILYIE